MDHEAIFQKKHQVTEREIVVATTKGKLHFGPRGQVFYGQLDGRCQKRLTFIGE